MQIHGSGNCVQNVFFQAISTSHEETLVGVHVSCPYDNTSMERLVMDLGV